MILNRDLPALPCVDIVHYTGSFSEVFKAVPLDNDGNPDFSQPFVALKRLVPLSTPQDVLNEVRLLRCLGGTDHIIKLLDVDFCPETRRITLVLEYAPHESFKVCRYIPVLPYTLRTLFYDQDSISPQPIYTFLLTGLFHAHAPHGHHALHARATNRA